jgi:hypothetical protein
MDGTLAQAMELSGALGAGFVDYPSGLLLAATGDMDKADHHVVAAGTTDVVRAVLDEAAFASPRGGGLDDVIVTANGRYHLVRLVDAPAGGQVLLYLWLEGGEGNLAMARRRLRSLARDVVLV